MTAPSVLINAGNLKAGGALQVGASFLDEFASIRAQCPPGHWAHDARIVSSESLWAQLTTETRRRLTHARVSPREVGNPAVEFLVFGPKYSRPRARVTIMGFADGTILYPRTEGIAPPPFRTRLKRLLRSPLAWRSFNGADLLVVETGAVKEDLRRFRGYDADRIAVVENGLNARFYDQASIRLPKVMRRQGETLFSYVARLYPHKNFDFIAPFVNRLRDLGHPARVLVTLTDDEWRTLPSSTREVCVNVGPVTIDQVRSVYQMSDIALFPSLLECFSVTPLEALASGVPLIASDREFVKSICDDAPIYIDPLNPETAARAAADEIRRNQEARILRGLNQVEKSPNARQRADAYVRLIEKGLDGA